MSPTPRIPPLRGSRPPARFPRPSRLRVPCREHPGLCAHAHASRGPARSVGSACRPRSLAKPESGCACNSPVRVPRVVFLANGCTPSAIAWPFDTRAVKVTGQSSFFYQDWVPLVVKSVSTSEDLLVATGFIDIFAPALEFPLLVDASAFDRLSALLEGN